MGSMRKECMARDWQAGLLSSSRSASVKAGFPARSLARVRSWYTCWLQYFTYTWNTRLVMHNVCSDLLT